MPSKSNVVCKVCRQNQGPSYLSVLSVCLSANVNLRTGRVSDQPDLYLLAVLTAGCTLLDTGDEVDIKTIGYFISSSFCFQSYIHFIFLLLKSGLIHYNIVWAFELFFKVSISTNSSLTGRTMVSFTHAVNILKPLVCLFLLAVYCYFWSNLGWAIQLERKNNRNSYICKLRTGALHSLKKSFSPHIKCATAVAYNSLRF